MSLLADFWLYCQSYEIPRSYALWCGLSMVSAVVNRKLFIKQGDIEIHANIYACLVGEQGGRKSTPKDFARDIICQNFPDIPIGASVQSREDIIRFMASEESARSFTSEAGDPTEYHPYIFYINELKNFLSVNPGAMIEFLTDIYDRAYFDSRTIKRNAELVPNPSIVILACETPEWIIDRLKLRIISGGFSRRMLYIYEIETGEHEDIRIIPRPFISNESRAARCRVVEHLRSIESLVGEFKWTRAATALFDTWYTKNRLTREADPIMRGYLRTKDTQLLKVCMLLAASRPHPKLTLTSELLCEGITLLDSNEINLPKLSVAAGRNEFALQQYQIIQLVKANKFMAESEILRLMGNELAPMDLSNVMRYLKESKQLVIMHRNGEAILVTSDEAKRLQGR
jgi:hypothetical protein